MDLLRVGIIGLGVGEQHAIGVSQHPRATLAVLCDRDPVKLEEVSARFPGVRRVRDADAVLADPALDCVVIATYDDEHGEQVLHALAHGKHVFVEKPLCYSPDEARRIRIALAAHPGLRVSTNTILRTSQRFRWVKEQCDAGAFGELFAVEAGYNYGRLQKLTEGWRGRQAFYSAVYGCGIHAVDLLRWWTGDEVLRVLAVGNQIASRGTPYRFRDCIHAALTFRSGIVGTVNVHGGNVSPHFHPVALYGTQATFVNDLPHGRWYASRDPAVPPVSVEQPYPGCAKYDLLTEFIGAVLNGHDPVITEDDAFRTMAACFAIERAVESGEPVDVVEIEREMGMSSPTSASAVR